MQQQAKKMQKKLQNIHIESEEEGVTVVINGQLEVQSVKISDEAYQKGVGTLEKTILYAMQKGLKKAQEVAAQNMQEMFGGLGLPNM